VRNKVFAHNSNSIKSLNTKFLLVFLPLLFFGFYKNGIVVFAKNYTNIFGMFKPLIIPIIGFLIGYFITYIVNKYKHKRKGRIIDNYFFPIQAMIVGMLMPIKVNIMLFMLILSILSFIYMMFIYNNQKISINFIVLSSTMIIVATSILSNVTNISSLFINSYEQSVMLSHSIYRLFVGYSFAGISISNILLTIIAFYIMSYSLSFKKEISFYLIIMFSIIFILNIILGANFSELIRKVLNSSIIFIITFVANDSKSTPYTKLAMFVYSLIVVALTLIISIFNFEISIYVAIMIASILTPLLNKMFKKTKFIR